MLRSSLRFASLVAAAAALAWFAAPVQRAHATPVVYCSNGGINLVTTGCISGQSSAYSPTSDGYYSNAGGGDPVAAVEQQIFLATGTHVTLTLYGKSDDNASLFTLTGAPGSSGTWTVKDGTLISYITVKAANSFALYQFDPATASGNWTTDGILNNGGQQPNVSHISFWVAESQPVPEPASLALFAVGLGLLALLARRKRHAG